MRPEAGLCVPRRRKQRSRRRPEGYARRRRHGTPLVDRPLSVSGPRESISMTFNDGSRCCRCWRQEAAKRNPRGWAKAQKEAKARRPARPRAACAARAQSASRAQRGGAGRRLWPTTRRETAL